MRDKKEIEVESETIIMALGVLLLHLTTDHRQALREAYITLVPRWEQLICSFLRNGQSLNSSGLHNWQRGLALTKVVVAARM